MKTVEREGRGGKERNREKGTEGDRETGRQGHRDTERGRETGRQGDRETERDLGGVEEWAEISFRGADIAGARETEDEDDEERVGEAHGGKEAAMEGSSAGRRARERGSEGVRKSGVRITAHGFADDTNPTLEGEG